VLVIAATDQSAVNRAVSRDARALRLPVNVVDAPELCSVIVPALVDRSPVLIAVGTGGSAPVLARSLRGRLEAAVPSHYGALAELAAKQRSAVHDSLPDVSMRRRFWEEILEGECAELVFRGDSAAAERLLCERLASFAQTNIAGPAAISGEVYLIGAGPNDPELISFRALRCLQRADLVLAAHDVTDAIVELSRRDAARLRFDPALSLAADGVLPRLAAALAIGQRGCILLKGDGAREPLGQRYGAELRALGLAHQSIPGVA
jgi:uroporphyrin-III C-methyltransferase/precorrin-2 dehydrogenase/sirohydrochlorin ferrochelatase